MSRRNRGPRNHAYGASRAQQSRPVEVTEADLATMLVLAEPPLPNETLVTEARQAQWKRSANLAFDAAVIQPGPWDALGVLARAIRGVAMCADMNLGDALVFVKVYAEADAVAFAAAHAEADEALPQPPTKA